jgi:zinc ribbon protein
MTSTTETSSCARCGAAARSDDRFCVKCGADLAPLVTPPPLGKGPVQWKWVGIGAAVIVATQFGFGFVLGAVLALAGSPDPSGAVVAVVALLGLPIGGVIVALMSPGLTIREPAIGAVIAIAVLGVISGHQSLLGLLLGYVLTLGGAKLGERLQGRSRTRA